MWRCRGHLVIRLVASWAIVICLTMGVSSPASALKVLNRATSTEPSTIDPHIALGNSASVIIDDLFVGLMAADADGNDVYALATNHQADETGLVHTFALRQDAVWSDGTPITSADVVYSFRRLMDPKTAARFASNLFFFKNARAVNTGQLPVEELGVSAPDDFTIVIELEKPTPFFLAALATNALTIVPRQAIEAHGLGWARPGNIVVNGPYTLSEWLPNTQMTLTKNPLFWDADEVAIDEVRYYPTDDAGTGLKRYRADELDIILSFPPEQVELLQKEYADQINVSPNLGLFYWAINTSREPFDDVRVRKALSIAIDREGITQKLLRDLVDPAWGLVPPATKNYEPPMPEIAQVPFAERQQQARDLLKEAGFSSSNPLKLELRYDSKEEARQIAVAVSAMWRQIGVEPALKASDFRAITADVRKGNFDVIRYQWYAPFDDPSTFLNLLKGNSRTNHSELTVEEFDAMLLAADAETDLQKRAELLSQAEALILEEYGVIPIYFAKAQRVVKNRVLGWKNVTGGNTPSRFLDIAE